MQFYFIYSAGGGAGDWNGVKRMWHDHMPTTLKSRVLLKFGDVFISHAPQPNYIIQSRWNEISNLRTWLQTNVNDQFIQTEQCNILLDSGTSKMVNWIRHHNPAIPATKMIKLFDEYLDDYNIFEKYVNIITTSNVNSAVTLDIPNPFKIRSQNGDARLNVLDDQVNQLLVKKTAEYCNEIYRRLVSLRGEDFANNNLMTIINGTWTYNQITEFFQRLSYSPKKLAIGALSGLRGKAINPYLNNLSNFNLNEYKQVHFLGCGGLDKIKYLKNAGYVGNNITVDCSTFINRSIDGSKDGNAQSGYYDYNTGILHRIKPSSKEQILALHRNTDNPLYSLEEMEEILDKILQHQSNNSSPITYNARAKLIFHNADVYRRQAEL